MAQQPRLDDIGIRRELRLGGISVLGRRRRPSGEPEPLPRELQAAGRFWLAAAIAVAAAWSFVLIAEGTPQWWTRLDLEALESLERFRTSSLTSVSEAFHALGSVWSYRTLRWATILVLVGFRRWRHLVVFLASMLVLQWLVTTMAVEIGRVRPVGIEIIGDWEGFSHPSVPVASLSGTLVAMAMSLIPLGRLRSTGLWVSGAVALLLVLARSYLGVDHLSDGGVGIALGFAIPFLGFRLYAPDEVFPVSYRGGKTAHLEIDARREAAIRDGIRDQIGFEVVSVEPFALEGSAGSTPLRITIEGEPRGLLFGKLYASNHLRSDRWYKLARTILYGSLEDEVPFTSVRRLVEYEDYMLRVMRDEGLPSAEPYGFVEITAEREYVLLTSFLDGGAEIGEGPITEEMADKALLSVHMLWTCGIAHRDIKPSNVMTVGNDIRLIDVAFATLRPTPWRQAVDLANMLLILSLQMDPEDVLVLARRYFAEEDVAEAFAAARGVTIPTQLRGALAAHKVETGVDLLARWVELTPHRDRISIQRWSASRIAAAVRAAVVIGILAFLLLDNLTGGGFI